VYKEKGVRARIAEIDKREEMEVIHNKLENIVSSKNL
jgi:hypothetical protein